VAAVSIPLSLWAPAAVARREDQRWILLAVMSCYPIGYIGLMVSPHDLAILWALLVGVGAVTFPIVLVLIGLRSRTPQGTAALSGFTQSTGYLLAAVGPFGVGLVHDATGGWTWPLVMLAALSVPQILIGLYVARPTYVEDQLRQPA
jgi:CP family cyanate transporter-like MFS transporter